MTPERWQRLKELLEAALELDPARRAGFLNDACRGDSGLLSEISSLLAAHEEASRVLPLDPIPPSLEPLHSRGEVLAKRFRIERFLGRGGMGEVYGAWDEIVQQVVAVKTLLPQISGDAAAIVRLRQEVQNARKVTHPNVCRVFDLIRDSRPSGDVFLLTMELVDGETLAARLARTGPVPRDEALELATQLAQGLDAAHQAGIVHRDFKPGNVMIEAGPAGGVRAVVTDFGVARNSILPGEASTRSGELVGTPAYMAPEQLSGEGATAASDIYAFGIVICELISGRRPSSDGAWPPKGRIPRRWFSVIKTCLDPDPSKRPGTAGEAVGALVGRKELRGIGASRSQARWLWVAGAALAVALLAFFVWISAKPAPPSGSVLLLSDVVNLTQDPDLASVGTLFRSQLQQSSYVNLWDPRRLPFVLRRMGRTARAPLDPSLAREIAYRDGASLIASVTVAPVGDQLAINVLLEMLEPGSPNVQTRWRHAAQASGKNEVFGAVHESCEWLRKTIGEPRAEVAAHDRPPEDVTTTSWQALSLFTKAERFQVDRESDKAIQLLKQAVTLDSHFALGYMRLGDISMANRRQDEGLHYWHLAIGEADRGHLARHEELRLRGLYAGDTWDWPAYESSFAEMEKEFPNDWLASFYLGNALVLRGRLYDAEGAFQRASSKNRDSIPVADNLGGVYLQLGQAEKVRAQERELRRLHAPDHADVLKEGELLMTQGDFQGALAQFRALQSAADPLTRSRARWYEGAVLAEMGRAAEAEALLRTASGEDRAADLPDERALKLAGLSYLLRERGAFADARNAIREAAALVRSAYPMMPIAAMAARLGEKALALELTARVRAAAPGTPLATIMGLRTAGEIALAERRLREALGDLRRADSLDSSLVPRYALASALEQVGRPLEALEYFSRTAQIRQYIVNASETCYPGLFTTALRDTIRCARAAGRADIARDAEIEFARRRHAAAEKEN